MVRSKTLRKKGRRALVFLVLGVTLIGGGFALPLSIIDNYRGIDIRNGYGGVEFEYDGQVYGVFPTKYEAREAIDTLMDADPDAPEPPDTGETGYPVGTIITYSDVIIIKNEDLAWEFFYAGSMFYATTSERAMTMIDDLDSGLEQPNPEPGPGDDPDPDPEFTGYRYAAWVVGAALTLYGSLLWSTQELEHRKNG